MRRRPTQTVVVMTAIIAGVLIGQRLLGPSTHSVQPDVSVEHGDAAALIAAGFALSGGAPTSWRDISLRLKHVDDRQATYLRCVIAPDEADRLVTWPPGSRRPEQATPPSDWPNGPDLGKPAWWMPNGGRCRLFEQLGPGGPAVGIFAIYQPESQILHLWQWQRSRWQTERPSPLDHLVADELASHLIDQLRKSGQPADAQGWFNVVDLPATRCGIAATRKSPVFTTLSAAVLPVKDRHRYLLALHGISEVDAWRMVGEQPQHPLPDDALPPAHWQHALPDGGLPTWFAPGPGPRRAHGLVRIGTGRVEAARWCAYDRDARTLMVWDWSDAAGADPLTDPTPSNFDR